MNELCDCGRDITTIQTTDNGAMCDLCFNEKYGFNGFPQNLNKNGVNGKLGKVSV